MRATKSRYLSTPVLQLFCSHYGTDTLSNRYFMNSSRKASRSALVHIPISVCELFLMKSNIVSALASSSIRPSLALPSSRLSLSYSFDSVVAKNNLKQFLGKKSRSLTNLILVSSSSLSRTKRSLRYVCK